MKKQNMYSRISGTGSYLPARVFSNKEFEKYLETSDEWILDRTGIKERRIIADDELVVDMACAAANNALEAAGITAKEIDLIIVATTTPDLVFPSVACTLQAQLKATVPCPAFDIQAACGGFLYAMSIADMYIKQGHVKNALVIGAEAMSRLMDWTDRGTCILFGDGAGAVILSRSEQPGVIATHIHADGSCYPLLYSEKSDKPNIHMEGRDVFKQAVRALSDVVDETLEKNNIQQSDIDWLVPHQANLRIIQATAKKLSLPMEKVVVTVDRHGNTSAASVPLALDEAVRDGRIKRGELLLLEAFGAGFSWGSALVRY
jgi:3-oxoacyl-[acyl-carrier-protein] synthase III